MSTARMGGIAAILIGLLGGAFILLTFLASPEAYEAGMISWPYVFSNYALALTGLLGLAAVPAISDCVSHLSPGWTRWTSNVAMLGFALLAILNFWQAEYEMLSDDPSYVMPTTGYETNASLVFENGLNTFINDFVSRTPHGWIEAAGIGLWILTVSWLSLQSGVLSTGFSGTGIAAGFLAFCTATGANLNEPTLHVLGTLGGSVVTPVWFVWAGALVLSADRRAAQNAAPSASISSVTPDTWVVERPTEPPARQKRKGHLIRLWPN